MMTRFLVGVACSILVVATDSQVPTQIPVRTGPPVTDAGKDWEILSIGGWWVKVNAANTTTRKIQWHFGRTLESLWWGLSWERPFTRDGRIPERFLYPGNIGLSGWVDLLPARVIFVRASTKEETNSASFCVFYQEQAVARIDFVRETIRQLDATHHEARCAP